MKEAYLDVMKAFGIRQTFLTLAEHHMSFQDAVLGPKFRRLFTQDRRMRLLIKRLQGQKRVGAWN
jgi:hypothetical protein